MERSHTPLNVWFWAAYLVASQTPGMSAVQFQRQLGLSRYETAFQILHKLRSGMVRPNQDRIGGQPKNHVEVDETWVGGRTRGEGRGVHHKVPVSCAIEVRHRKPGTKLDNRKDGRYAGRVRLAVVLDRSAESLCGFVESTVAPGSLIVTDDWSGYAGLGKRGAQQRCVVAMEACASAHYWGREILKLGHEVRLVPPIYVKPFVKRQKNDAADAEAIYEAAQRPTMRFVAVKGEEQQARAMLFHTRDLLVRQRTQTINALRGHLAEFGVIAPQGPAHVGRLASALEDPGSGLPGAVRALGGVLLGQIADLDAKIGGLEKELRACARQDEQAGTAHDHPRGSGRSTRWRFRPSRRRWRAFGAAATSLPGWASCRDSTRPAASQGWAGYRRWANAI